MFVAAQRGMRLRICAFGVAALLLAPAAHAGLAVLTELPGSHANEIRIASGGSGAQSSTWISVALEGSGSALLIIPLAPGARADLGSIAWIDALELATAPRITPPPDQGMPVCGSRRNVESTARPSEGALLVPTRHAVLPTGEDLRAYASWAGFDPDAVSEESAASTGAFLLAVFELGETQRFTRPIRIVSPGGAGPLTLEGVLDAPIPLTHFGIGARRLALIGFDETGATESEITWVAREGESDFEAARSRALDPSTDTPRSFVEHASSAAWLTPAELPTVAQIPPICATYLDRAHALRETELDPEGCMAQLEQASEARGSVGVACAAGALGVAPDAPGAELPCDTADESGVHPDLLRCGGADELAYALSGLSTHPVLTRTRLLLDERSLRLEFAGSSDADLGPIFAADRLDATCPSSGQGGTGSYGSFSLGGSVGSGGYDPYLGAYQEQPVTPETSSDAEVVLDTADSCSGAAESSGSCSGSTHDDGYDGETCGGDSDDGYDGETCGGDSDSGYEGETCGGDGGGESCDSGDSSGYSGETCSGSGSGSGYSGETCSGSSGSGSSCAVARPRTRPRLSALVVLAACMLWPLRRSSRRDPFRRALRGGASKEPRRRWLKLVLARSSMRR